MVGLAVNCSNQCMGCLRAPQVDLLTRNPSPKSRKSKVSDFKSLGAVAGSLVHPTFEQFRLKSQYFCFHQSRRLRSLGCALLFGCGVLMWKSWLQWMASCTYQITINTSLSSTSWDILWEERLLDKITTTSTTLTLLIRGRLGGNSVPTLLTVYSWYIVRFCNHNLGTRLVAYNGVFWRLWYCSQKFVEIICARPHWFQLFFCFWFSFIIFQC